MNRLTGWHFDGHYPVAVTATLTLWDGRAGLTSERGSRQYDADALRVSPRIGQARRFVSFPDAGQLQCDDSPLLDALPQESPTESPLAWLEERWSVALIGAALMLALLASAYSYGLPRMAAYTAAHIPITAERDLGRRALRELDRGGWVKPTALPLERQDGVRSGFSTLLDGMASGKNYSLEFRAGSRIGANAVALPGGIVVITDEMVYAAESPEEVMAVLAHEIGHVELHHALRQVLQDSLVDTLVTMLTGDAATGLPTALAQAEYSRDFETQADDYAFALLKRHDISPSHFADLLQRLDKRAGASTFLDSHPSTPERIRRARAA